MSTIFLHHIHKIYDNAGDSYYEKNIFGQMHRQRGYIFSRTSFKTIPQFDMIISINFSWSFLFEIIN